MSDEELREAVERVWKEISLGLPPKYKDTEILLALAQQYLELEGFPDEKAYDFLADEDNCKNYNPSARDKHFEHKGFNEALRLCKLAAMKPKVGREEIKKEIMKVFDFFNGIPTITTLPRINKLADALLEVMNK